MAGPTLPAVGPDGTPITIPASQAHAVEAAGGHIMSAAEAKQTQARVDLESKYDGTIEGTVAPFAAGVARGASVGVSDVVAGRLGGEGLRRKLLDYQEYAPGASMAGEFAGIAGSAVLGDEAGLASLPGLVGRAGAGVEAGTAAVLGGSRIARGAGALVRGATEGAIYAAGKAEGDAALHDQQLTTEQALSAVGHGALFGAGTNAIFAGAGAGLSRLMGREAEAATPALARVEGGIARAESREASPVGEYLQKSADVKTIKAFGGSAGDLRKLEETAPGGFRKVAQDVREDIEASTGKSIGFHNRESIHDYASSRREELGEKLGGMMKKLDEGGGQSPDASGFIQQAHDEVLSKYLVQTPTGPVAAPGAGKVVKAVDGFLAQIKAATDGRPPSFVEWQGWRRNLDKSIYEGVTKASPSVDALRQVRAIMEKELETAGEAAAQNVGGSFAGEYRATKSLYQSVTKAEELSARGVAAELGRNSVGLGATIGAATGLAAGGPIAGVAMGAMGKLVKDRGDMLAADLLQRAANLMGVQRLAARTNESMSKGVAALIGTKPIATGAMVAPVRISAAPMGVALSGDVHKDYAKVSEATIQAASNPAQTIDRVAKALGPEAGRSPELTAAVTQTMLGDVAYLSSKLPQRRTDTFTLQQHLQPPTRASDAEKADFLRYAEAVDRPLIMLEKAMDGSLTPQTVEAVRERRPKLYDEMRTEIAQSLATSTTELPYGRRIQLGILLDLPTDQTLAPDFVSAIQATYSASEKAGVEPPPPQLSTLDVSGSLQTATQAAAGGMDR